MLKDWSSFDKFHQLLVQKFCSHGVGFLYHEDDVNWKWRIAGLEDFKLPRSSSLDEAENDIACVVRDINVAQLYKWVHDVPDDDHRWNKKEVYKAIIAAKKEATIFNDTNWEAWQKTLKNNDLFAASVSKMVKLVHVWVTEYSGKVSQYITLRDRTNEDYLFKCENRFGSVNECYTFFPYEVGTNGTFHGVRGMAHEKYPEAQVLNTLRCQNVDNARITGSMILQPKNPTAAEDMALIFYAGVVYIPPEVEVANAKFQNPSDGILPVIQDMSMLLEGAQPNPNQKGSDSRKTKFQVQNEVVNEAVLPTASLNLFYQPWKRHLNETWRRANNKSLRKSDPGADEIYAYRERCIARGVPKDYLLDDKSWIEPMRAVGFGSPGQRQMAFDEFMEYYGSLDPVGQNNLLRDRFAQKVGYAQVDRYVPKMEAAGREPYDIQIAELQNVAMSAGTTVTVLPNDNHIIHLQAHLPNLGEDLDALESGQGDEHLLNSAVLKTQHSAQHMKLLVPDKLQKNVVAELTRLFNNLAERTSAAMEYAQRQQAKEQQKQAEAAAAAQGQPDPETQQKLQQSAEAHSQKMGQDQESHQLKMTVMNEEARQKQAVRDAESAQKARQTVKKDRAAALTAVA